MSYTVNPKCLMIAMCWTLLFAAMSFYWALGGMIGIRSLGGSIYEQSLNPDSSFLLIVWATAFMKILGAVFLLSLRKHWQSSWMRTLLYSTAKIVGMFLFLYGFLNFLTIGLHAIGWLDFALDRYATWWRLLFWEPFWMLGAIRKYKAELQFRNRR